MQAATGIGAEFQKGFLLPPLSAGGFEYSARCRQVHEVGGDFYRVAPLDDGRFDVTLGDASGKGRPAALISSSVQWSLRTAIGVTAGDPAATLALVNRQTHGALPGGGYAAVFHGIYNERSREMSYVNAGHVPPVILRRDGSVQPLEAGGPPVGLLADSSYEEGRVRFDSGDILIACTDGVTEQDDPAGDFVDPESLLALVRACRSCSAADIVDTVYHALDEFAARPLRDDASLLVLKA